MTRLAASPASERQPAPAAPPDTALLRVLRAVRIIADDAYELAGRSVQVDRAPEPPWPGHVRHPEPRVEQLRLDLYERAYVVRIDAGPAADEPPTVAGPEAAALAAALSAANGTVERWDAGWSVLAVMPNGSVAARKGDRVRVLVPGEFHLPGGRGAMPVAGAAVRARVERESWTLQPGYCFVFGEELGDAEDEHAMVRIYWNVRSEGAALLVGALTGTLNRFAIPFRFKCPAHPAAYRRIDAGVLYLARRHWEVASGLVADVHAALADRLDEDVPLFTRRLARGLGLAEDPGGAESFGTHRCRVLAESLWDAHAAGAQGEGERLARVRAGFARHGLDLDRPHLGPRSKEEYAFPGADAGAR